ncbi:ABC transporter ATP-binding protein [Halobellus clavatus]|uniref:Molybdate/tungstate import ATP-binding protein WtpC n=1 Tax=Halobellus clavatus TaxID=660517 RepID=A0A1H3F9H0_9EURY|nr:ABC transporter ATP-binding protein [Halobellus clavatus]SDX87487.1 thiamine transport system ATP-binding protein [Halobellus clavatus]
MTHLSAELTSTFTAEGAEPFTVDAALEAGDEETVVILGPSGSGKTLLLETLAGFHGHEGTVTADSEDITDRKPEDRDFGFVFQDYALFPHMTVRENVEYGARYRDSPRDADELLAELGVGHLTDRSPPTLSGGEKQRVALARALAVRPEVLLLDEPLAALDVPTRQSLRDDLVDVLADVTSVYVTHNRTTARAIADRIIVMADGRVVQRGTPEAVFERPKSSMVAKFTGSNVVDLSSAPELKSLLNGSGPGAENPARPNGTSGQVAIRPEAIRLQDGDGDLRATVQRVVREDATNRVTLAFDDVTVEAFADHPPSVGSDVSVTFPRDRFHPC